MEEKRLLGIALIGFLVGLLIIFFLSQSMDISPTSIDSLQSLPNEQDIKIMGAVTKIVESGNNLLLTIEEPKQVKVFLYQNKNGDFAIQEGDQVEILGTIDTFRGEKQIIADRIRVIP
ncbi:hypothetical protein HYU14_06075 [Candidatus Woesearchaeota archaeon]|nr:hypothetical protein [Candidatus Woesearchaeota archaeon]